MKYMPHALAIIAIILIIMWVGMLIKSNASANEVVYRSHDSIECVNDVRMDVDER